MQSHARVVVVGGGCVGANILYHLSKRGWTDVVLLERTELTAGSTWHAAGLIPLYSFSHSFGRMIARSIELYEALEAETGQPVGWHKCGQLRVANTRERMDEYLNYMSLAETQGIHAEIISPQRVHELWPMLAENENLLGALYHPDDGHIAPADITQSVAKGARDNGASIHRNTEVNGFECLPSGEWKVKTNHGDIVCEHVVTATGNYVQQTGRMIGASIPAYPVLHQYWVTEPVPDLERRQADGLPEMPVLRDETINGYVREERNSLMFGPYERPDKLEHFAEHGVPDWFGADLLPENFDSVEANWEAVTRLLPVFNEVGIKNNVRGPICVTPDNLPLVGPAAGLRNFWLAEGFSGGILGGGGVGEQLAIWIMEGEPEIDLSEIDSRRFGDYANHKWTGIKNREAFGHNFGVHFPGYEWPAARPSKTAPCHDRLTAKNAVWGSVYGWETPLWYAPEGVVAKDIYSYREFNYFPYVGEEVRAVRNGAGFFEMTSMAKYEVSGPGAEVWLNSILANRMPATVGRIVLCHLLTPHGGVRAEFTVTRITDETFYLVGTPRGERHDFDCLSRLAPSDGSVALRNVTLERGCFTIVGPLARDVLQPITDADLSNDSFPWLTAQTATVGWASDIRMLRVNYEGELGWELYHPICHQLHLFDVIFEAGQAHGLRLAGNRAIESLRLDKSYRAMYRDLNVEHTALESGLDRFIRFDKNQDFTGRAALLKQQEDGVRRRMVTLKVDTKDADAYMGEGVYNGGSLVGRVTSGAQSHYFGHCISMAYVDSDFAQPGTELEIPILGERRAATVLADSPYDPQNQRPRA